MVSITFIINPISGIKNKRKIPKLIEDYIDKQQFRYDLLYSEYRGHAYELALNAVNKNTNIVCAVGGDGSVHEIAKALINTKTILAILPTGSGNGIARHFNIPRKIKESILLINQMHSMSIDTAKINDNIFIGFTGFGIDAIVAKKFDEDKRRGLWTYTKHIFREYFRYHSTEYEISIDNKEPIKRKAILCAVANTSEFGNGFLLSPKSDATDGKFELVTVKPFSFLSIPNVYLKFYKGNIDKLRGYESTSFKNLEIRSKVDLIQIDGEPVPQHECIKINVIPKSLQLIVPTP